MKKLIIGITGILASGKTTVANMLVEKGAVKIDADVEGHRILDENEGIKQSIVDLWGEDVLIAGKVNRDVLRKKVFTEGRDLEKLNKLMHPAILASIRKKIDKIEGEVIVIDAPLLIEAGLHEDVDIVVVVSVPKETAIGRVMQKGLSREEAENILLRQLPLSEKEKAADYVIDNNDNIQVTNEGVEKLWKEITSR